MNPRNKIEAGEFFFRFYRKRISSFLVTIYKAGITGKDKDIHKLRVDLKKVIALFNFFEILEFSGFHIRKNTKQFREIFRQAGKIREIQVNLSYIEENIRGFAAISSFKKFLKKEQKKYTGLFISAVVGFDENKLKAVNKTVKKFCSEIESGSINEKSSDYLYRKAGLIKKLAGHPEAEGNVHKIRQELKKMGAIASLLVQFNPSPEIRQLITKLTQTETLIGVWHDRIVLIDSIENYLKSESGINPHSKAEMEKLKGSIGTDTVKMLETIMPLVSDLTDGIRQKSVKIKANSN